jgi:hypothetical protein
MTSHETDQSKTFDSELILSAALKLFALYLIFLAVLSSGYVLSMLLMAAGTLLGSNTMDGATWMNLATTLTSLGLAVGFGVVLLWHGNRAAHWLGVRSGATVPALAPTIRWYRGTIAFLGFWLIAIRAPMLISQTLLMISSVLSSRDEMEIAPTGLSTLVLVLAVPVLGCVLILRSQRIGDWLYRIANPEPETEETV